MSKADMSNLTRMQSTGKEIAAMFAGAIDPDMISSITQALLNLMSNTDRSSQESRLMLLGALAVLGQEVAPRCQTIDVA